MTSPYLYKNSYSLVQVLLDQRTIELQVRRTTVFCSYMKSIDLWPKTLGALTTARSGGAALVL